MSNYGPDLLPSCQVSPFCSNFVIYVTVTSRHMLLQQHPFHCLSPLQLQEYDHDAASHLASTMALLEADPTMLSTRKNNSATSSGPRDWDDEYTVKHHLKALIPAFDPRPGRMNIQQTVDLEIPPPGK